MGVLLAPFLRKSGDYTVPSYPRPPLREPHAARGGGRRAGRAAAAAARRRGTLCRLRLGVAAGQPERLTAALVVSCVAAMVLAGGMRSQTWSGAAKAMAALVALAVPATIVA